MSLAGGGDWPRFLYRLGLRDLGIAVVIYGWMVESCVEKRKRLLYNFLVRGVGYAGISAQIANKGLRSSIFEWFFALAVVRGYCFITQQNKKNRGQEFPEAEQHTTALESSVIR